MKRSAGSGGREGKGRRRRRVPRVDSARAGKGGEKTGGKGDNAVWGTLGPLEMAEEFLHQNRMREMSRAGESDVERRAGRPEIHMVGR